MSSPLYAMCRIQASSHEQELTYQPATRSIGRKIYDNSWQCRPGSINYLSLVNTYSMLSLAGEQLRGIAVRLPPNKKHTFSCCPVSGLDTSSLPSPPIEICALPDLPITRICNGEDTCPRYLAVYPSYLGAWLADLQRTCCHDGSTYVYIWLR